VESLADDFSSLQKVINRRRNSTLPALRGSLKKEQMGPEQLVQQSTGQSSSSDENPHVTKYSNCGAACIRAVNSYYKEDFDIVRYPLLDL
jgi:hypothetical protein